MGVVYRAEDTKLTRSMTPVCDLMFTKLIRPFADSLLASIFICVALFSQPIRFERMTVEQGLPDGTVICMLKDRLGFMWFGTTSGLMRYDGYSFRFFTSGDSSNKNLSGRIVYALLEDQAGLIWVATVGGGLNKFDPRTETFTYYRHDPGNPHSLSHDQVYALLEDRSGRLWVGTTGGLDYFDRKENRFHHFDPDTNSDAITNKVTSIYERPTEPGILWIGTFGLRHFDIEKEKFVHYRNSPQLPATISHHQIWFVQGSSRSSDILWIGTVDGLNKFEISRERFTCYKNDPHNPASLSHNGVRSMLEDRSGNLWIGTSGGGLNLFDPKTGECTRYITDPKDTRSLSNNNVVCLFEDECKVHWVGTRDGINRFASPKEDFVIYQNDPHDTRSLSNNFLWSLYEDRSGVLWIATGMGLNKFNQKTETFSCYKYDPEDPKSLRNNYVRTIYEDRRGILWVGNANGMLHRFDRRTGNSKAIRILVNPSNEKDNDILSMLEDKNGTFWVGTAEGLQTFDRERWISTPVNIGPLGKDPTRRYQVNALYEDRDGTLWIGTGTEGLLAFNSKTGGFTAYSANAQNLSHNDVAFITRDRSGILWVATRGGGLSKFNDKTREFTRLDTKKFHLDDIILGFLEDNSGNFWFSVGNGLCRFNPMTGDYRVFDAREVQQGSGFNTRSFCKSKTGAMYFGGVNGLDCFYPDSIQDNTHVPPVHIVSIRIHEKEYSTDTAAAYLKHISLASPDNSLSFEFSALDFKDQRRNNYAYMLEGLEKEWIYCGSRRYAAYTGLAPGRYVFRVKGSNNNGVWNEAGTSFIVVVEPAYWQTWWFKMIWFLLIVGLIAFVYHRRVSRLHREKHLQQEFSRQQIESQEAERKRLAAELHDGLGQDLLIAANELQEILRQKTRSQAKLKHVAAAVQDSIESAREIAANLHPHHLDRLGFSAAIRWLARTTATSSGVAVEAVCGNIDGILPKETELHLFRIIQEALSNAIRHASATQIRVEVKKDGAIITAGVSDNGKGFVPRDPSRDSAPDEKVHGYGLSSLSERARIIGGTLKISSTLGTGTSISITIPSS